MMSVTGLSLILQERNRQRDVEGFSAERDDQYTEGQLTQAADCYRVLAEGPTADQMHPEIPLCWPHSWDESWWKPTDRVRNLAKAGALYQAEIDRLFRLRGRVEQLINEELSKR